MNMVEHREESEGVHEVGGRAREYRAGLIHSLIRVPNPGSSEIVTSGNQHRIIAVLKRHTTSSGHLSR